MSFDTVNTSHSWNYCTFNSI